MFVLELRVIDNLVRCIEIYVDLEKVHSQISDKVISKLFFHTLYSNKKVYLLAGN